MVGEESRRAARKLYLAASSTLCSCFGVACLRILPVLSGERDHISGIEGPSSVSKDQSNGDEQSNVAMENNAPGYAHLGASPQTPTRGRT
jgi:hypothetical protein